MSSLSKKLQKLMITYFFSPQKKLDQNYLINETAIKKIIQSAEIKKTDIVLEIGSGCGFLTSQIVPLAKKTIVVEKDPLMIKILKDKFKNEPKIEIIEGNILKVKLPKFNKIVSSPPFSISSKIIERVLEKPIDKAVFLFQREFVDKLNAFSSLKDYTFISVLAQSFSKVKITHKISKTAFFPQPPIDCSVVVLDNCSNTFEGDRNFHKLFLKAIFRHKNKKIKKALIYSSSDKEFKKQLFSSKKQLEQTIKKSAVNEKLFNLFDEKAVHCEPDELVKMSLFLFKHKSDK